VKGTDKEEEDGNGRKGKGKRGKEWRLGASHKILDPPLAICFMYVLIDVFLYVVLEAGVT